MTATVILEVTVDDATEKALEITFHEGLPEEETIWVPKSIIHEDFHSNAQESFNTSKPKEVGFAKWFLKKNDIDYSVGEDYV